MKNKDIHIRITDEEERGLKKIALKEKWSKCKVGQEAIRFYLKARKIISINK